MLHLGKSIEGAVTKEINTRSRLLPGASWIETKRVYEQIRGSVARDSHLGL